MSKVYGEKRKGYLIGKISYKGVCYEITQDYDEKYNPFKLYKVISGCEDTSNGRFYCDIRVYITSYADMVSIMCALKNSIEMRCE